MPRPRDAALRALNRVDRERAFAAAALTAEIGEEMPPRDAALATELTLGVLRRRSHLDRLLESASRKGLGKLDPTVRNIARLGAYQIVFSRGIPARAAVSEAVEQTRRFDRGGLGGLVNALLRRLAGDDPATLAPREEDGGQPLEEAAVDLGLPQWLLERFVRARGRAHAFALARLFNRPSRRTMRVNGGERAREELLAELEGVASPGRLSPWAIDVERPEVAADLARDGRAVHQDEGAQLAVLALDVGPGQRILDACAGRGGKTGALASAAGPETRIMAADRSKSKLERLDFELARQGFEAETVALDLSRDAERLEGGFDRILLDAPCSGSGTLGRRPEIRWRLEPNDVDALVGVQARLLDRVVTLLAPGGTLVYAVCSVLPEEGAEQRRRILESSPDLRPLVAPPPGWPEAIPWESGAPFVDPVVTGSDGYQLLVFYRVS
jgi:16S rRNA (cytosine967-C5)-methyltransferase